MRLSVFICLSTTDILLLHEDGFIEANKPCSINTNKTNKVAANYRPLFMSVFVLLVRSGHKRFCTLVCCPSSHCSFSTDDDNDTEVEAVDMDTELNLVTECWVEPQSGTVMNCMDQYRPFQGLKYQEVPQAVSRSTSSSPSLCRCLLSI